MKRVLIVDDEKSFLLSLRDGLNADRKEFQVLTADNGKEAVAVLRTVPIDLLVTDLKLPVMDGFELLAWVSREQPQLPVIVMTAFGTAEIEARLSKMTGLQYLEKPLDLGMLREAITSGLKSGAKSYIRGITLATFLQLMAAEKKNCTLKVSVDEAVGYLFIRRGELIDAEYGELQGEEAAMQIVCWENAEIEMDGICRRQQQNVLSSMEHILIEAFRRKDEQGQSEQPLAPQPETETDPDQGEDLFPGNVGDDGGAAVDAEVQARSRLQELLPQLDVVQEYAIFDQKSFLEEKNSGKCSIAEFDPAIFIHLQEQIDQLFSLGSFCNLSFKTADRYHYLLFRCQQHRVLIKLKPGAAPQEVVKEIRDYVNR